MITRIAGLSSLLFQSLLVLQLAAAQDATDTTSPLTTGLFRWKASPPLIGPGATNTNTDDPLVSIKDPTIVRHEGRWHLFATVRFKSGKVDIQYANFADFSEADQAPRHILGLHDQYYCAPQVFYFSTEKKWYLIFQLADEDRTPRMAPFYSTTTDIADPRSWSKPQPLLDNPPEKPKWLDFWLIFDDNKAHLFYTSLDGHMWRIQTSRDNFPTGWSSPELALEADIFEASHTYKLEGRKGYLTVIEAQGDRRRYYKAYLADRLEGPWKPLADNQDRPFAGLANVAQETPWTTNISHGELLRLGTDERLVIKPDKIRFLFQGASDPKYRNNSYGQIPWRLGLLELRP